MGPARKRQLHGERSSRMQLDRVDQLRLIHTTAVAMAMERPLQCGREYGHQLALRDHHRRWQTFSVNQSGVTLQLCFESDDLDSRVWRGKAASFT